MKENTDDKSYQLCLDKAFLLLAIRMQTEHELWEKLGKKSEKSDIFRVILRLKELGYVDDSRFVRLWIESRSHSRGPNLLRNELLKRGIKRSLIDEVLIDYSKEQQLDAAREAIKAKNRPELTKEVRFKKLGGLLSRRGFSYDIINKVLNE
jgi:regulatory protein